MSVPKAPHETSKTTCEGRSCRHRRHARGRRRRRRGKRRKRLRCLPWRLRPPRQSERRSLPLAKAPRSPHLAPLAGHLAHPALFSPLPKAPRSPWRQRTSLTLPRSSHLAEHLARSPRQAPRPPRNCSAPPCQRTSPTPPRPPTSSSTLPTPPCSVPLAKHLAHPASVTPPRRAPRSLPSPSTSPTPQLFSSPCHPALPIPLCPTRSAIPLHPSPSTDDQLAVVSRSS
jgi:hypothetical protein